MGGEKLETVEYRELFSRSFATKGKQMGQYLAVKVRSKQSIFKVARTTCLYADK